VKLLQKSYYGRKVMVNAHVTLKIIYSIGGVMVSVLALSAVDRGFEPWSGQTKDYKIGICCYPAKHATLRRKSKDWLLLFHANLAIFQLYHGENKFIFNEMMMRSALY
jgi:hypothetical protein